MQGKTHFFVGIAASLAICRPQTFPLLVAGTGAAAVGGVISDIDIGNSSAHHDADKIIAAIIAVAAAVVIADINLHIGIYDRLLARSSQPRLVSVLLAFFAICAFGKSTKHRSFMHSLLAMALLTVCVWLILPDLVWYFGVAFASHLLLDLLNRRKMRLLWPSKKGYGIGLCTSGGWMNRLFLLTGIVAAVTLFMTSVPMRSTGTWLSGQMDQLLRTISGWLRALPFYPRR